jgi:hypothetical protein
LGVVVIDRGGRLVCFNRMAAAETGRTRLNDPMRKSREGIARPCDSFPHEKRAGRLAEELLLRRVPNCPAFPRKHLSYCFTGTALLKINRS